ncbi:MAG: FecR domain-containing protein [Gammaproteobacteria bacterium]|nr:FecR domain-containing protein [Gammaproteobacteria bacterium]MBU1442972.1 FecR domain-containing protein [Gammaproteobacteria bacterium]MBU2408525.1 FecR domain-containing protein [Gammaproteobacteria bacterium]
MKKYASIALCGFLFAAATVSAQTPKEAERAGTVKEVRGTVELLDAAGTLRPARAGDALAPIDRIVTGADGAASAMLRDGTILVVGPSSRLDLKEFHFDSTTRDGGMLVALLRGSLRMITGLIGKANPDAVRVETQTATIGIRGTDFIVQADPQP